MDQSRLPLGARGPLTTPSCSFSSVHKATYRPASRESECRVPRSDFPYDAVKKEFKVKPRSLREGDVNNEFGGEMLKDKEAFHFYVY